MDGTDIGATGTRSPAGRPAEEIEAVPVDVEDMLARMAVILESELSRFEAARDAQGGEAGRSDGKAAVDFVALFTKALEKVDQLIRAARAERIAALRAQGETDAHEREELAERIAGRLNELAEDRARRLAAAFRAADAADLGRRGA